MDNMELIEYFKSQMKEDPDMASAVAAIRTLLEFLKRDKGETIQGLRANLTSAIETLCGVDSSVAVSSGGELFLRFISLTSLEYSNFFSGEYHCQETKLQICATLSSKMGRKTITWSSGCGAT
ncbi:Translation initiation factor [Saguinus oedipus]|uniref:Translation initiation factor n=1 Tax=Saguinus oedipus TaxID=9490 RepID=A0ABQ9V1I9_SAGOE|nr:Translation initiation factor [Saguinus oedipus]